MAPKGVSSEEKRKRLLEIFHEEYDVFMMKDIEKRASNRGIQNNAAGAVLQELVDDELVLCDKIGSSKFYWSFPRRKDEADKYEELEQEIVNCADKMASLIKEIDEEKKVRETSEEREKILAKLAQETTENVLLTEELAALNASNEYKDKEMQIGAVKMELNLWNDNIETIRDYCLSLDSGGQITVDEFDRYFAIPEDLRN
ncbi:meiotic nuclear division protein 1 [Gongronella butleri]|nr:meiotic nuclear division protein 1 [Gongronella butleri]